jgi:hypothetical protein
MLPDSGTGAFRKREKADPSILINIVSPAWLREIAKVLSIFVFVAIVGVVALWPRRAR